MLQSRREPAHVGLHPPVMHVAPEAPSDEHAWPQDPQFWIPVFTLVSHPSSGAGDAGWLQSPQPLQQEGEQVALSQEVPVALAGSQT